jgi:hypothetical protein
MKAYVNVNGADSQVTMADVGYSNSVAAVSENVLSSY